MLFDRHGLLLSVNAYVKVPHLCPPATPRNSNSNRSVRVEQVVCGGEAPHHLLLALLLRTPVCLDVRGAHQLSLLLCEAENLAKDRYHLYKRKLVTRAPSWWQALCTALQPSAAQAGDTASARGLRRPRSKIFPQNKTRTVLNSDQNIDCWRDCSSKGALSQVVHTGLEKVSQHLEDQDHSSSKVLLITPTHIV